MNKNQNAPPPANQPVNPFDSSSSEQEDDQLGHESNLISSQPYEERFQQFNEYYNNFMDRMVFFQDQSYISNAQKDIQLFHLNMINFEHNIGIFDVIKSQRQNFDKICSTFVFLDVEVNQILEVFEQRLFDIISMYGERPCDQEGEEVILQEGQSEIEFSRILGILKQIYDTVKKMMDYLTNIVAQLCQIYRKESPFQKTGFKHVELFTPIETIGQIISIVYTIDRIVNENQNLRNHWNFYKRMVTIVKKEPQQFNTDAKHIKAFEQMLSRLDQTVLSGQCLGGLFMQNFDPAKDPKQDIPIQKNKELYALFQSYFKSKLSYFNDILGSPNETFEQKNFYYFLGAYAFHRQLFQDVQEDKELWQNIWSLQKKSPIIFAHSNILVYLYKFLDQVCPLSKKSTSLEPKDPVLNLQSFLANLDERLTFNINTLYTQFCTWISRMESLVLSNIGLTSQIQLSQESPENPQKKAGKVIDEQITTRIKLLMTGLSLACQIKNLVSSSILLHLNMKVQIRPDIILQYMLGFQMLKAIEYMFNQQIESFNPSIIKKTLYREISSILLQAIDKLKKADAGNKQPEKEELIISMQMVLRILKLPVTPLKIVILNFYMNFVTSKGIFENEKLEEIKYTMIQLEIISQSQYFFKKAAECNYFYWARDLIPLFLNQSIENPSFAQRLYFLFNVVQDANSSLKTVMHLDTPEELYTWFQEDILKTFNEEFLVPLTTSIEDFLRINIHSMLITQIKGMNPFEKPAKELNQLLSIGYVQIFDSEIDIKKEIEHYLNEKFYNMNAMNMYDMETYEEMRSLANYQFGINLMHVFIPSQTIEQSAFDVLNIIRSIPQFVQQYTYNLHSQTFVEISTDSKQVNSVGVRQFSDSIKTHGPGILNTTVNQVFIFIGKKINPFSQFIFDDIIQSPLIREQKYFQQHNDELEGKYPYDRAELLYKQIKKLGVFQDGSNFLDKFRKTITSIGNAIGFVRLLRSSSLNYSSKNIEFLPSSIVTDETFCQMAQKSGFGDACIQACKELDELFTSLQQEFSKSTDYLKIFVKTLYEIVNNPENKHLKLFYLILPPLTINYVESVMMAKEKLGQRNTKDTYISDDGFSLGLVYFLKLLNQNEDFGSLHWRDEVQSRFTREIEAIQQLAEKQQETSNRRVTQEVNLNKELSLRKMTMQLEEFDLFFNTFYAAKLLFSQS